ncbi:putative ferredoxin [Mycolicibacterium rhodesiae JS60]|nr:putative ferredoxin [Mycolicibacterium rhodesiae JS60]
MRVHVDASRCQGHGLCYAEAPDIFADDEIGHAFVTATDDLDEDQLRRANAVVRMCPELAITVSDSVAQQADTR